METRQDCLYSSVPVIKPWQGQPRYGSSSLPCCQRNHLESNAQRLPRRCTALDLQRNSCIVNTRLDLRGNLLDASSSFVSSVGSVWLPKEVFRSWGCTEINQRLMPRWSKKTNERSLWGRVWEECSTTARKKKKNHVEKLESSYLAREEEKK